MFNNFNKVTIIRLKKPQSSSVNNELQWFSQALGLFSLRDKERSCFRIFVELLKCTKKEHPISSDELAFRLNLTRGTVIHHLNKLIASGIAVSSRNKYLLRAKTLKELTLSIKKDVDESFVSISEIAEEIDSSLNL